VIRDISSAQNFVWNFSSNILNTRSNISLVKYFDIIIKDIKCCNNKTELRCKLLSFRSPTLSSSSEYSGEPTRAYNQG